MSISYVFLRSIFLSTLVLSLGGVALAQFNVTTANYDNRRSNSDPNETILTHAAMGGGSFGKLGGFSVDGQIYAQPLYVSGVQIPGQSIRNIVYVVTMNDNVYAFDADAPNSAVPLWSVNLGTPVSGAVLPQFVDIPMNVGILSTPVIDVAGQVIYLVSETFENGAPVFRLHGMSLADGHEMVNGPQVIAASVAGSGGGSVNGTVSFDPLWHLQRPGLMLANGKVYVAFGSHGDSGNYHGWLIGYNAANLLQQGAVFNTTPNGLGGAIWQSGRAPAIDDSGNIYVVSGNGDFDGDTNLSGAIIKLSGVDLSVLDWYTPANWQYLDANDLDVGSTGAILLPGANLALAGDKGGRLMGLNTSAMGHIDSQPGSTSFKASGAGIFDLALWQSSQGALLYEHDWHGFLKAYPVSDTSISATPSSQGTWSGDSLYQGMTVSSNGGTEGVLWETTGDHSQPGIPGTLHAWNASDLTQELWNSNRQAGDTLGAFAKFVPPLVANGRVYVPTLSNQVVVYGLHSTAAGTGGPQIVSVLNGASFIEDSVSPGEILAILGTDLGPATTETLEMDPSGNVSSVIAGTEVFFDGLAAPLLSSSSTQVEVVVPFGVTGTATQIVVRYGGQSSAPALIPVVPATPALFSASGLGGGQGAIVNADGSVNSSGNPTAAGSTVSLFATGLGTMTPAGQDGVLATGVLPTPNLPVSAWIAGLPASVTYAGAAPGMVEGMFQINLIVPALAPSGPNIIVTIQVGGANSPSNIWLAIQ